MALTQIRGNTQIISGTITDAQIAAAAAIASSKLADGANFLKKDGSVALTANLPAGGFTITGLATPTNPTDAATMGYVDSVATGLDVKASVRAATTANITLSGTQTIDGVSLSAGNRVLVKDQSTGSQNGIYVVAAGAWGRSTDADASNEVTSGMFTFVEEGTTNADSGWTLTTDGAITLGTTSLVFVQFSGAGTVLAGTGLQKVGNTLSIDSTVVTLAGTQTLTNKSIDAGQLTGTVLAGRLPAFTGDVTTSAGTAATTIANNAVTYAKIQTVGGAKLLGNTSGSAANVGEIALGTGLSFSGATLGVTSAVTLLGNSSQGSGPIVLASSPNLTNINVNQAANGNTAITSYRFTDTAPTGNFLDFKNAATASLFTIDITGTITLGTVPTARLSGTLAATQFPALTGDVTTSAGALGTTLATVNSNTGSWGIAGSVPQITVNGKGLITAASNVAISITASQVSNFATTAQGYRLDQFAAPNTNLSIGSNRLINVSNPIGDQDAATKLYVDSLGFAIATYATTTALPANTYSNGAAGVGATLTATSNAALTVDSAAVAVGDIILVKNEATSARNGIYSVTATGSAGAAYVLTRAINADTWAKLYGKTVHVINGSLLNGASFIMTSVLTSGTMGTTIVTFEDALITRVRSSSGLPSWAVFGSVYSSPGGTTMFISDGSTGYDLRNATQLNSQSASYYLDAGNISAGTLGAARLPALTGDITTTVGTVATTIAANVVTLGKLATLAANSVIGNSTGSTATPTAVSLLTTATASSIAFRNTSANLVANNFVSNLTTQATAAGTTTLTVASSETQQFTGSTTQTVVLPDATTLTPGHSFVIANRSSGIVTVNANGGGLVQTMAPASQTTVTVITVASAAGTWDSAYSITNAGSGGGTVTTLSVVSTNGLAGTVANPTTTPAITLTTTVTGVLKGNGTAISAATVGTDFVNNASFVTRETPTGLVNGSNTTYTLANTPTSGTEQVYLNGMLQEPGAGNDYTISGATITYLTAPLTNDKIRVNYMK